MKPTSLKAGARIISQGRAMIFIRRDRACCGQQARNWFHCADYIGLNGPKDDGRTYMTDYQVSRNCERA